MKFFDSFLEIAGNLGFLVGNNDRVRERARREKRSWGTEHRGFAVSAVASSAGESLRIEVALRNTAAEPQQIQVPGWLDFFSLTIRQPDATEAQLNSFGKRQLEAAHALPTRVITLNPGDVVEADIPVSSLYDLRERGMYSITGTCRATGAVSHVLEIRI